MIEIRKMTASFGRLDNETLCPTPGLNVFSAPNESGKSTWAAFLTAMFYGIDTAERVKKGTLPAKVKYKPWNGKPMEGTLELNWNGRDITIQRQSDGRIPMGRFTAYDTHTGQTLDFLNGENCGRTLLGVEQSVFVRSAFIGQNGLSVTQDAGLEQKLSALVTTGEESVSFTETEKRLRDWKNHVRHNRTGYLPEAQGKLAEVTEKINAIRRYHAEDLSLYQEKQALTEKLAHLEYVEQCLKAGEAVKKQAQLQAAKEALESAEASLAEAKKTVAVLPSRGELEELQKKMDTYAIRRELFGKAEKPQKPTEPVTRDIFRGLSPEEVMEKASRDVSELQKAVSTSRFTAFWVVAILLCVLGIAGFVFLPVAGLVCATLAVVCLVGYFLAAAEQKKKLAAQNSRHAAILLPYGAKTGDDILLVATRYNQEQQNYARALADYEEKTALLETENAELECLQTQLLETVRAFGANIYSIDHARDAVAQALSSHQEYVQAKLRFESAESSYGAISDAIGQTADVAMPAEDFSRQYSLPQVAREITLIREALHRTETTLAQHQGNVDALGDPAALEAEKQALQAECDALSARYDALTIAMDALSEANQDLRSRFSPQISKTAGELLSKMTRGRYDAIRMEQDLSLWAKQSGDAVSRELLALSGGTADQLYLALRLAICKLALDAGTPLILDDALVFFDDTRLAQTMELLKEEAETRQILLFSCQQREAEYLANHR